MALKYGNRVKVSPSGGIAPALGDFVLGAPVAGYQSFSAAISGLTTGDTVRYVIEDGSNWEIGTGTYNTTGPKIVRTTVIQSSAGGSTLISAGANSTIMISVGAGDFVTAQDPSMSGTISLNGEVSFSSSIDEAIFVITGTSPAINPVNGTIQTWTLTANSSPSISINNGQSMTLMVNDGTAYSITWPTVIWMTNSGSAPFLSTAGYTTIILWKVGGDIYGARVGNA